MSHAATAYVKELKVAPDGSKLKAAEKAVLMALADWHNEEIGCAWPSMKELAGCCGIGDRYCRQIIEGLERKRIIKRIALRRENGGGQTSNEYIFSALGKPVITAKLVEARRKLQRVPRLPMSGRAGNVTPPPPERRDRAGRNRTTATPGTPVPSIEPLVESSGDSSSNKQSEPIPPTPHSDAREVNGAKPFTSSHDCEAQIQKSLSNEEKTRALLKWARDRFNGAIDDMRVHLLDTNRPQISGLANGYADWQEFGFNSLAVEAAEWRGKTLMLVLCASDPAAAQPGLYKYRKKWEAGLRKWFDCEVHVEVQQARRKWGW